MQPSYYDKEQGMARELVLSSRFAEFSTLIGLLFATLLLASFGFSAEQYTTSQTPLFLQLNHALSTWPGFWENVTELGDAIVLFPLLSLLIIYKPEAWAALFGAIPLSATLSILGKNMALVPRPAAVLSTDQMQVIGPLLTSNNSLPSGHTITAFAVAVAVIGPWALRNNGCRNYIGLIIVSFAIAALVAISRVAVGAHWPVDTLIGAALGITGGASGIYLSSKYSRWWIWMKNSRFHRALGLLVLLLACALTAHIISHEKRQLIIPWVSVCCALIVSLSLIFSAKKSIADSSHEINKRYV